MPSHARPRHALAVAATALLSLSVVHAESPAPRRAAGPDVTAEAGKGARARTREAPEVAAAELVGDGPFGRPEALAVAAEVLDPATYTGATLGILVTHVESGEVVYAWRPDAAMVPASTMKVLTAAAALDALGPSYTFTTSVWRAGTVEDGVLRGDLVVVGGGDPTMTEERLWRLLRQVRLRGVHTVTGDVILDDSFFDEPSVIPGWDNERDHRDGPTYFPGVGALQLGFGTAAVVVRPGPRPGAPAEVLPETPAGDYLIVDNRVTTGRARSRTRLDMTREVEDGRMTLVVQGTLPVDAAPRRFERAVPDPGAYFAGVLGELLGGVGITVQGRVRQGILPAGSVLLERTASPHLSVILADQNKYSSNFMAETVLRTLGAEVEGFGTTEAGLGVIRGLLDRLGVPEDAARLVNGSGLTREGRLTPRALVTVIREGARDRRIGPELVASLSIGGRDGTLARRFGEAEGQVRGKTGTLAGVATLAGLYEADDGELYAFAFLANDAAAGVARVRETMDAFLAAMMSLTLHE